MPPEWIPRCRGKPSTCIASAATSAGSGSVGSLAASAMLPHPPITLAHRSSWPRPCPSAVAMSRTAERAR